GEIPLKKPPAPNYPTVVPQPQATGSSAIGTYALPAVAIVAYLAYRYFV
ncbi:4087_t:CDS:2, partial [Paraglomus occultum]